MAKKYVLSQALKEKHKLSHVVKYPDKNLIKTQLIKFLAAKKI
jgi:hypothetical protein